MPKKLYFHGGCHGCTQQEVHGTEYCMHCCYFDANWDLPSCNNRPPTAAEQERERLVGQDELRRQQCLNLGLANTHILR